MTIICQSPTLDIGTEYIILYDFLYYILLQSKVSIFTDLMIYRNQTYQMSAQASGFDLTRLM
jgi:hypothetical protein